MGTIVRSTVTLPLSVFEELKRKEKMVNDKSGWIYFSVRSGFSINDLQHAEIKYNNSEIPKELEKMMNQIKAENQKIAKTHRSLYDRVEELEKELLNVKTIGLWDFIKQYFKKYGLG